MMCYDKFDNDLLAGGQAGGPVEVFMINPELRALLVCPVDHSPLDDGEDALECPCCGRRYPIVDGIPDMVPDEEEVTSGE